MVLCDLRGKLLYEVNPSLFPAGELSETEVMLWELYYKDKNNH